MATSIITTEDLANFKKEMLGEIRELLKQHVARSDKKYLRSGEVMNLMKISASTLSNFRKDGTLPYSKIGGLNFYEAETIANVLEERRVSN